MFRLGVRKIVGLPVWRSQQQVTKLQNLPNNLRAYVQCQPYTRLNSLTPVTSNKLFMSGRTISLSSQRPCHSDSTGGSGDDKGFSMKALSMAPKPALFVGFSGLIPFLSAPLLMAVTQSYYPEVAHAQMVYGACIVSFLGGARWGFAIPEGSPAQPNWKNVGNSVVPSLLAWLAILCKENISEAALVVLMGLGLSLHYDLVLLPGYPAWFKAMRTVLTLVATFSLVATLVLKRCCTEKKIKELRM
ncbi:transmembrane protein 69-like [Neosynchiropus ocellatus]